MYLLIKNKLAFQTSKMGAKLNSNLNPLIYQIIQILKNTINSLK